MSSEEIVGVVLAAGESSRFGSPKHFLPFAHTTLLGQVVENANASALERVVVVLGRGADPIRRALEFGRAELVENTAYGTGCASSLLAGLDAAADCAALMLLLGDQPGVTTEVIDRLAADWRQERSWATVTSYRGEIGHPFLFASEAFPDLRRVHGDKAVWKLIEDFPHRLRRVEVDAELPPDVDRPEDYPRALEHWRRLTLRARER